MVRFFDGALNLLIRPIELFLDLYEPFWDWLVKHDKYVYIGLFVIVLISILS